MEQSHALPDIVRHMIAPDTEIKRFPRQPEMRENDILFCFVPRWKYQYKCRDVACTGKVKTAVTLSSAQGFEIDW